MRLQAAGEGSGGQRLKHASEFYKTAFLFEDICGSGVILLDFTAGLLQGVYVASALETPSTTQMSFYEGAW